MVSTGWNVLAFLLVIDVIDSFIEWTGDGDLPQELVSYFETHHIGGERVWGPERHRVKARFRVGLRSIHQQTCDTMARTNNRVEASVQNSETNTHPSVWKRISLLTKEEILGKKCNAEWGDKSRSKNKNKVWNTVNKRLGR